MKLPTWEWASKKFHLPEEGADIPGLYDLDYVPYMYGIFAALDNPAVKEVDVMKAAQVGWTFALIAYICKLIDVDPGAIVVMFAKEGDGRQFGDEKLVPAIEATPAIAKKVDTGTSRASGNRALYKKFPRGFLKLVGSNSPGSVKSTPADVVIVEEPDDANENLKDQGDSISLLWERTKRKKRGKRVMGGTPSVAGLSRIEEHVDLSDARVLPIQCHECDELHVLDFDNVSWLTSAEESHKIYGQAQPETAVYCCPHCGAVWDDYQRKKNIRDTVQAARDAGDENCGWVATQEFHGIAGFKELNELYACLPGTSLADLVGDYLEAEHYASQGKEEKKIVFVNSKLGRTYEYKDDQATDDDLEKAALDYQQLVIPPGGLVVTVGIDVQHDRVAIIIRAWGRGEESWLLYWDELYAAETCISKTDPVWQALDDLVFQRFTSIAGWSAQAAAVSIDSSDGTTSDAVYEYVRSRQKRYKNILIMAIKGSSAQQDPEIFSTPRARSIDHKGRKATKADRRGLRVFIVGTNKAKDWIAAQLKLESDEKRTGIYHYYAGVRGDYYKQITSEIKAPSGSKRNRKTWQAKKGRRNEAWDCEVYALHAARAVKVHLHSPHTWDAIEERLKQADLFPEKQPEQKNNTANNQPQPAGNDQPGGFVNAGNNWINRR